MHRCIELARLARGNVAPNPMVGAVLVYQGKIIGEGYHQQYGSAHAEVNCIASVRGEHQQSIDQSTLFVSLEPCAHFGKTPPCVDLIIEKRIPKVVVGCRDPFVQVNGKGIEKLKEAGIEVELGILENECKELNKRFFTLHTQYRPYVVLKWAQTLNNKLASLGDDRLLISNEFTNRLVHKWRSEEMAILVGTNTAFYDDPQLNTRLWPGKNAIRLVVDINLRLPSSLKIFDKTIPTIVFNKLQHSLPFEKGAAHTLTGLHYYQVTEDVSLVHQILNALYHLGIQSILVEGGAKLLQSCIDEGAWDEARIITNEQLTVGDGLPAPQLNNSQVVDEQRVFSDVIRFYQNAGN